MVRSTASTAAEYLEQIPPERRDALAQLRANVLRALPSGFIETIQHGMISYVVPLPRFSSTYNGQPLTVLALASQAQYMAIYLNGLYGDQTLRTEFEQVYLATGKKFDMGKSCLRFKRLDDLAMDVILTAVSRVGVDELIAMHDAAHPPRAKRAKADRVKSASAAAPSRTSRPRTRAT
jgi:hypothetical protein